MVQPTTHLGKQLRAARLKAGITQAAAASAIHCAIADISRWEVGERSPSVRRFGQLCKLYNADPAKLLVAASRGKIQDKEK